MAAAGDPALVRRMSAAIQRILDLLTSNLSTKAKAYKSKVTHPRCWLPPHATSGWTLSSLSPSLFPASEQPSSMLTLALMGTI